MSEEELVISIADKAGIGKKDAERALKAFTDTVIEEMKAGGSVRIIGFGTFSM